ncbi:hypothetical protein [Nitrosomonas sp. Nm166]|uniref:hypothetical protein n=1 Tax=Nitrosomonas sp. Nm166 TaxID=1881054 RepID=UPI0015A6B73D|nr:hypothetical protein [Nitrosomonas sp. Nm166]
MSEMLCGSYDDRRIGSQVRLRKHRFCCAPSKILSLRETDAESAEKAALMKQQ